MITYIKTEEEFQNIFDMNDGIIILKFGADWCASCKAMDSVLKEVDEEAIGVNVVNVNVDKSPEIASEFRVMSIPTTMFIKDKAVSKMIRGTMSKKGALDIIDEMREK